MEHPVYIITFIFFAHFADIHNKKNEMFLACAKFDEVTIYRVTYSLFVYHSVYFKLISAYKPNECSNTFKIFFLNRLKQTHIKFSRYL